MLIILWTLCNKHNTFSQLWLFHAGGVVQQEEEVRQNIQVVKQKWCFGSGHFQTGLEDRLN